jgi:hypothetical protein
MALAGWNSANIITLTIDSLNVDSELIDFPVLVSLSSITGQGAYDATVVFDELGSNANRKKIAITDSDDNELYVEIERWDHSSEVAELWVKVPTIASGTDTDLYFYYDSAHAENTTYVGDTTEAPAQSVWNSNFVLVWHMAQDPSGGAGAMKDSTSGGYHGTSAGSMGSGDLVDAKTGKGIRFDGNNDKIEMPNIKANFATEASLELLLKLDSNTPADLQSGLGILGTTGQRLHYPYTDGNLYIDVFKDDRPNLGDNSGFNKANWHTLNVTQAPGANNWKLYQNTTKFGTDLTGEADVKFPHLNPLANIGESNTGRNLDGIICEFRLSKSVRNAAWLKTTYYSNWNDLLTFTFSGEISVSAGLQTLSLLQYAPTLEISPTVLAGLQTLSLSQYAPTINISDLVIPSLLTLTLSVYGVTTDIWEMTLLGDGMYDRTGGNRSGPAIIGGGLSSGQKRLKIAV